MFSNTTNSSLSNDLGLLIYGAVGHIIEGLIIGISNLLIGCSIAKYEALHSLNQYILLMTLAFGDAFHMFGMVMAGIYRLLVILTGSLDQLLSPAQCLLRPHVLAMMLTQTISSVMLVVLSADRLFLVAFPETYLLSLPNPGYAKRIVWFLLMLMMSMFAVGVSAALTKDQTPSLHPFCYVPVLHYSQNILNRIFVFYFQNILTLMGFLSVFVFALVLPAHKYRMKNQDAALQGQNAQSQKRMTKSLGISCACTLFLYCIPLVIGAWAWGQNRGWLTRNMIFLAMSNSFANVFIYQLRHPEMKMAFKGLLFGKTMPTNLNLWNANNKVIPVNPKATSRT